MGCHCNDSGRVCQHQPSQAKKTLTFPNNERPSFLPLPSDDYATVQNTGEPMPRIGPWATGRVMWTPTCLTGIRPVVDRYSVTRYSPKEWRKKNLEALNLTLDTSKLKNNVRCTIHTVVNGADRHQTQNTVRLEERVKEVRDCASEMEALIKDLRDEIVLLTETKIKLKFSLPTLKMPESIAGECLDRRSTRLEPDLVNDEVEVELVKELSLIKDTRELYLAVIRQIEEQMRSNRACKDLLESTWSDKKETCELDSINSCLKNTTPIITHHGGAARFPDNQSTPESWAVYNATLINTAKEELERSRCMRRATQNTVFEGSARDLRRQADKVHDALMKRIDETDQCRQMFERELDDVLRQIAEAESLYDGLIKLQIQLEQNSKVVETRLENRLHRRKVENCRDPPQYGLIDETKFLSTSKSDVKRQIEEIDQVVSKLYETRGNLEYFILTKRKSLYVDQQRCMAYRERYPDANALGGANA